MGTFKSGDILIGKENSEFYTMQNALVEVMEIGKNEDEMLVKILQHPETRRREEFHLVHNSDKFFKMATPDMEISVPLYYDGEASAILSETKKLKDLGNPDIRGKVKLGIKIKKEDW